MALATEVVEACWMIFNGSSRRRAHHPDRLDHAPSTCERSAMGDGSFG